MYYWQRTGSRVWCESQVERWEVLWLDYSGQVERLWSQPLALTFGRGDACSTWTWLRSSVVKPSTPLRRRRASAWVAGFRWPRRSTLIHLTATTTHCWWRGRSSRDGPCQAPLPRLSPAQRRCPSRSPGSARSTYAAIRIARVIDMPSCW